MKSLSNIVLSIVFCLFVLQGFSQQPADTAAMAKEETKEKPDFRPEAIRVGIDLSRLLINVTDPDQTSYELNADLSLHKYLLSADWGTATNHHFADGLDYQTSGRFFRAGADINFIPESKNRNAFFLGLRFGRSNFEEKLNTTHFIPGWDTLSVNPERRATARWFEGVGGLRARVWNNFYLGYTLRYKFGLKAKNENSFIAYEVPGFGVAGDGNKFSFSYHLLYRIPFRKTRFEE